MNKLLESLYDTYYDPYEDKALEAEIDTCRKALSQVLNKPDHSLLLHIIDNQGLLAEKMSIDSFIAGFRLAWRLWGEVERSKER